MRIAVMGTGGVGGYFGGRLARAGHDVTFIARGEHLKTIRDRGLQVNSYHGGFLVYPAQATDDPARVGPVDIVMFSVKMWDTEPAGQAVRPLVGQGTAVISFQNGVGNEERLAAIVGPEHVMGGVAYVVSAIARPGLIQQSSAAARLIFGELDGQRTRRAETFHEACRAAGIDAELSTDIQKELWTKFVYICALSGIGTLMRTPLGPILADADTRDMFVACMREVDTVAHAKGIGLDEDTVERHLAFADRFGAEMKSSMLYDLERGNRLELEWLNGAVARMGQELGVETPVNRFIFTGLKLHSGGHRKPPGRRGHETEVSP